MRRTIIVLAALVAQLPGIAAAAEVACPPSITETPVVTGAPPSWRILATKGDRPLDTAGLNSGDPADMASLVPDDATTSEGTATDIWNLAPGEEYWVACNYADTSAGLFQKVPAGAKTCAASYTLLSDGQRDQLKAVSCQ